MNKIEVLNLKKEQIEKKPEFLFEEGLKEIKNNIANLLKSNKYVVVEVQSNAETEVGKSTLSQSIVREFSLRKIPILSCANLNSLQSRVYAFQLDQLEQEYEGGVILLDASSTLVILPKDKIDKYKKNIDSRVEKTGKEVGLEIDKVDLRIFIYRPDKPSEKKETDGYVADIIIRNEKAQDRPR